MSTQGITKPADQQAIPHRTQRSSAAVEARAWRDSLPRALRESRTIHGVAIFGIYFTLYWLLFLGAFLFPAPWMRALAIILQPMVIGGLFVVGHDAGHHSLVPQGWLNRLLGRLAMLPAWHPLTAWAYSHNTLHHGGTNLRGRHPDFVPMTKAEYDALPWHRRAVERVYRSAWGTGWSYVFDFYVRYLLFPRGERRPPAWLAYQFDRALIVAFVIAQAMAGWQLSQTTPNRMLPVWGQVALAVAAPWLSWIWFIGFMSYLQHTHPRIAWYDDRKEWTYYHVQLKSTTHVRFPWPLEALLNNITDHAAHHLDPTIPLYHLPACQQRLEESCPEHAVVLDWSLRGYLETCRACKLYDFERHCWTDFQGQQTSEADLPNLPWRSAEPPA